MMNVPERWAHLVVVDEASCWLWVATLDRDGYGKTWDGAAHRVVFEYVKGKIPDGLHIDHLCRVRRCVNPDHLEPVTKKVNDLRGASFAAENARKTECVRGHAFTPENTYVWRSKRICRTCRAVKDRRRRPRRVA